MRDIATFFFTCVLVYLAWELPHVFFRKNRTQALSQSPAAVSSRSNTVTSRLSTSSVPSATSQTPRTPAQAGPPPLREIVPSSDELRSETAADPHSTPSSLLRFSMQLYQRQVEARQSDAKAREYFEELRSCALGEIAHVSRNTEAVCLLSAKKLQTEHPWLSADFERLVQQVDPATAQLIRGLPI